jgi:hypothetical protein
MKDLEMPIIKQILVDLPHSYEWQGKCMKQKFKINKSALKYNISGWKPFYKSGNI